MRANELVTVLQALLQRPVEGVVLRRFVGDRLVAHRLGPEERVDLSTLFDVVALVPVEPVLLWTPGAAEARAEESFLTSRGSSASLARA